MLGEVCVWRGGGGEAHQGLCPHKVGKGMGKGEPTMEMIAHSMAVQGSEAGKKVQVVMDGVQR